LEQVPLRRRPDAHQTGAPWPARNGGQLGRAVSRPFVAVNNLFDKRYVGSVTINGFDRVANAPRGIEPAPGINVYAGAEVGWRALR
jgi:hypothetical protein